MSPFLQLNVVIFMIFVVFIDGQLKYSTGISFTSFLCVIICCLLFVYFPYISVIWHTAVVPAY